MLRVHPFPAALVGPLHPQGMLLSLHCALQIAFCPSGLGIKTSLDVFYSISQTFNENSDQNQTQDRERRKLGWFLLRNAHHLPQPWFLEDSLLCSASMRVLVSRFYPIFPMQLLSLVQRNLGRNEDF